ncbi:kinetochore protein SPC24 homolog [Prunus dulcis]|uniref:kinetochore protein SPC24 homolog n=1 Tax=Prunus dulcis TaxID=3755 RepID=UPI0014828A18|nr:kinetochore protein SPC24 homolog [Prunus dulcis]
MGEASVKIDLEKLILYSDDLVGFLKDKKDLNNLEHSLQHSKALRSSCDADFNEVQNLLQDYEKKIDACKQKTEVAYSEVVADEEIDLLQRELDGVIETESLFMEELRVVTDEINDLERQRIAHQEKRRISKRHKQDEFRKLRELSMLASVTNIIPKRLEDQSSVLGSIVDGDTKTHQKFEFDLTKMTAFETCNSIWKMIS